MRRAALALAAAALVAVPARAATTVDSPGCVLAQPPAQVGATEVARTQVGARVLDLTLRSQAMGGEQHVDVLLPQGYDAGRRYPVLYLLHGAFGTYKDYVANGVEAIVGDAPVIVVMPDDGADGGYSDWYGTVAGTADRAPMWESYDVRELVPFIDRAFATTGRRFIAGLSSGGAGAMKYAAEHAGLFAAAGEFSGAVDTDVWRPVYPTISEALWLATLYPPYGPDGHCTWGDPYTQEVVWRDEEATYKAEDLRGTALFLATGDGNAGEYDSGPTYDPVEATVYAMNQELVKQLDAEGIPHTDHFYGAGTHTWPYWKRDLEWFMAWLRPQLGGGAPAAPKSFDFRSARTSFSAHGWDFTTHRDVREFVYLSDVSRRGLTAAGSGKLDVTTPWGLHRTIDLGPSHQLQQTGFEPADTAGWKHVTIRFP